ncbi:2OG-Fe dioxygenase family protein [Streptomyces sp. NPDC000151]|uniref:2OG-Fe dioxygenase family protein n=1 Tax=Streptomyces sp. NPDC000151 TaxID=3154244 RepID=UPI00332AB005
MRYRLFAAQGYITEPFMRSYEDLPADVHLRDGHHFRYRAFGKARVKGEMLLWEEDTSFFQSDAINEYAGGMDRRFAPLGDPAKEFAEGLVNAPAIRELAAAEEFEIGCHQIRITAADDRPGFPAPEGFHQDGYDLIAVTCVAAENVSGGISLVRENAAAGEIILERVMAPGESLFLADREVKHYVSPITPKIPGEPAYRDVAVITFSLGEQAQ